MDELKRGGFVFYHSYYEAYKDMSYENKINFMESLLDYAFYGKEPVFENRMESIAFKLIRANMDVNNRRYDANVENGKKGGAPKGNSNAKKKTTQKQAKNNPETTHGVNPKTTLMNMNKNMNMNYSDSYSNPHSKDRIPLGAETPLQRSGDYMSDYQAWRRRQMNDYGITSVGGDCYQTTIGGEIIIVDDGDFRAAFESGQNVNDYVAEKEGV